MLEAPLYQQANTYPARLDRQFIEDVFDVEGVIKPAGGALLVGPRAAGANMSVDIAAGRAVIKGDDEANQGSYRVTSTAVENRALGAAPGSDSRIDLVVAQVRDANVTGGASSDWDIIVIPGEVAAAPVAPAVPPTAIPLAQVLVAAGTLSIDAAKITDRRTSASNAAYVATAGGSTVTASAADVAPLVLRGATAQTATLFETKLADGTTKFAINAGGAIGMNTSPNNGIGLTLTTPGGTGHRGMLVLAGAADNRCLELRGAASHSANLFEAQNSSGTVLHAVTAAGRPLYNALDGTTALGTYQGFITVTVAGVARKIGVYA